MNLFAIKLFQDEPFLKALCPLNSAKNGGLRENRKREETSFSFLFMSAQSNERTLNDISKGKKGA
jgi:hypothetical protein